MPAGSMQCAEGLFVYKI